jgi:hypothetical protein
MITVARTMHPLPVRPVEPVMAAAARTTAPARRRMMHPLPVPTPEPVEMIDALRAAATRRLMFRPGVQQPLPVVDPAA